MSKKGEQNKSRQNEDDTSKNKKLKAIYNSQPRLTKLGFDIPPVSNFETFNLKEGVTLIEGNKIKNGPKIQASIDLSNLTLLSNPPMHLRMTKQEFLNITRSGNLNKSEQSQKQGQNNKTSRRDEPVGQQQPTGKQNKTLYPDDSASMMNMRYNEMSKSQNDSNNFLGKLQAKSLQGSIKVHDPNVFMQSLNDDMREDDVSASIGGGNAAKANMQNKTTYEAAHGNPNDQFNLSMLKSLHDVTKVSADNLILPRIVQREPMQKIIKSTLGFLPKHPRGRLTEVAFFNVSSTEHLPGPAYGKIMGHGYNKGYNPNQNLEKINIEQILDKLHNNSITSNHQQI